MSTLTIETVVPKAGVNKPKSRMGLIWDKLMKPIGEPPYKKLPDFHIRVVKIKPGTADHPLRVKLVTIDPRQSKYTALSYTWDQDESSQSDASYGPIGATQTIPCGGTDVKVSQNLYDALCKYRDVQSDVPVFVDALCINFDDENERIEYLEIMGHVYARASSVIVWLGDKDKDGDEIILTMRKLVNAIDWRKIGDGSAYNFRDPRFFHNIGIEPLTMKQWRLIHSFCHLRWFTRYWAFFELSLAKQALFLWGAACMEYKFLIDFGMILSLSGWLEDLRDISHEHSESVPGLMRMLGPVEKARKIPSWHPKSEHYTLWMREHYQLESDQQRAWKFFEILLQSADAFECRDLRDRVYAPLALVRQVFGGKAINKQWPRPDYRRSPEEVIKTYSDLIYQNTGEVSVLASRLAGQYVPPPLDRREPQYHQQQHELLPAQRPQDSRSESRGRLRKSRMPIEHSSLGNT